MGGLLSIHFIYIICGTWIGVVVRDLNK